LEKPIFLKRLKHSEEEINSFQIITDQYKYRKELIMKELRENDIEIEKISVILGRVVWSNQLRQVFMKLMKSFAQT